MTLPPGRRENPLLDVGRDIDHAAATGAFGWLHAPAFPRYIKKGGGPGWKEVEAGNEFRDQGGQERPVPTKEPCKNQRGGNLCDDIGRRRHAANEERQEHNLNRVRHQSDRKSASILPGLEKPEKLKDTHRFIQHRRN